MIANRIANRIAETLRNAEPVRVELGRVGCFFGADSGKDFDVLYVEIDSPGLESLHGALGDLPHADYKPHATIAYVKAGLGKRYVELLSPVNLSVEIDTLEYSDPDGQKTTIHLRGGDFTPVAAWEPTKYEQGHKPAGSSEGGQFTSGSGTGKKAPAKKEQMNPVGAKSPMDLVAPAKLAPPAVPTPVDYSSPAAFGDSLANAYAAAGHGGDAIRAVAAALPPAVFKRLSQGRLKSVTVHPTVQAATDSYYDGDPELRPTTPSRRTRTLGFYDWSTSVMETDGGPDPAGTAAHEIGHAVDNELGKGGPFGLSGSLSEADEFRYHWSRELKGGEPSPYAAVEPAEGFAEFFRAYYGGRPGLREKAVAMFPGVTSFFEKHGLLAVDSTGYERDSPIPASAAGRLPRGLSSRPE